MSTDPSGPERIEALERENRRIFDDAQREADGMFAQYQLSQLLASGGTVAELAAVVGTELARLSQAATVVIWLAPARTGPLILESVVGDAPAGLPRHVADERAAATWCRRHPGSISVGLTDGPPGAIALFPRDGHSLDPTGPRVLQLARHELAVAFRGARLRQTLDRERRELTAIVEGTTDAIVQVDERARVIRLNGAAARMLGRTAVSSLGRPCVEVLGCEVAGGHPRSRCPLEEVLASGEPVGYRETEVLGADGVPVRVAGGYSRSGGETGPVRATAILRDTRTARALDELREGFVATVSHELRTPLALIKGYVDTLLHLELDPEVARGYLERIEETTGRLTTLVTQILDITALQADPLVLERGPVHLAALVARLRIELTVAGTGHRLVIDLPPDLPPVEVDAARIGQVLDNVIGNALKYSAQDAPVRVRAEESGGGWLSVMVEDEGVGVPSADAALVFEPFHRAGNTRESNVPGTGLGLYIARRLVEAHGGELRLGGRSDGRPGTCASFTLPLAATSVVSP